MSIQQVVVRTGLHEEIVELLRNARRHMRRTADLIRKALDAPEAKSDAKFN
jgi:hypothetical protein